VCNFVEMHFDLTLLLYII